MPLWKWGKDGTHSCTMYHGTLCKTACLHICNPAAKSAQFRASFKLWRASVVHSYFGRTEWTRNDRIRSDPQERRDSDRGCHNRDSDRVATAKLKTFDF